MTINNFVLSLYFLFVITLLEAQVVKDNSIAIYEEILSTRNPNTVIDILEKIDIDKTKEDSLKSYFYYYKGSAYGQLAKFDSALFYIDLANKSLPKGKNPIIEIQIFRAYGNINWARNYYHTALDYYQEALSISNELNHAEFQISLLGNIAGIYAKLDNVPLALDFALKADVISKKSGVVRPRSHMKIGMYQNKTGNYSDGLENLLKTQELIAIEGRDSIALGVSHINIAESYLALKDNQMARKNLQIANTILNKVGYKTSELFGAWAKLAIIEKNYPLAKDKLASGNLIAVNQQDKDEQKTIKELSKIVAIEENQLLTAIQLQDEIYALNDSIKSDKMLNRVYELQAKYEAERKEVEIEKLALKSQIQEKELSEANFKLLAILVISVLIVSFLVVYYYMKNKQSIADKMVQEQQLDALKQRVFELQLLQGETKITFNLKEINEELHTPLTERELDTLKLSLEGKSNREIAEQLFVSINTIKFHLKNIYDKLGVANRKEALQFAIHSSNKNNS
ncbi:MAG: response regulator transcription factor [Cyclobacteriaceae bacterium]|nr:response regulator transcription factor [Cyclobacteriaceae bacterium]